MLHFNQFWMWIRRCVLIISSLCRWRVWFMILWIFSFYGNLQVTSHSLTKIDLILLSIYAFAWYKNIEKIAAHQIDPVRDIWMKGSSQGKISGWIQIFEIEENLDSNTNTNTFNKRLSEKQLVDPNLWNWTHG